jgi:outer membrane receptor protein involved in Fe transport
MRRTSRRLIFGTTLSSTIGEKTFSQLTVWANGAHNDGTFYQPFTTFLQRSRDLRDSQFGIKEDVTSALSAKVRFAVGGGVYFDQANYHTFENVALIYSPLEEETFAPARQNRLKFSGEPSAFAYAQATGNVTEKFSITPGFRVDHYGLTGETKFSPRLTARFNPVSSVSLTFGAGIYRQPPDIFVLSLTPGNRNLKTQNSSHIIGGIEWLASEDLRVRFEVYRKKYDNLIMQPLRPTPGFVRDGNYTSTGSGQASGFEISLQKALTGFFSGQASYGYIRSWRRFENGGVKSPSDFERPHQLTLIGMTRFYGFGVAAKYRIASGLPYTRRTPLLAGFFLQRIVSAEDINALRLPNFASLDLRVEKRFGFKRWSFAPYLDYFNITNHDSIVQPSYEFFSRDPLFLRENKRLPIFGLRIEF